MRCQPGDFAVVVRSVNPENVGLFVDVIGPWSPKEGEGISFLQAEGMWLCRAKGLLKYTSIDGRTVRLHEGPVPDSVLRPIRPHNQVPVLTDVLDLSCA